jgi:periplasmic divalent cation tolerance protein
MNAAFCYVTCPDRGQALAIARSLIDERLIACANIFPGMTSLYRWEGEVHEAEEVVLVLKTSMPLVEPVIQRVKVLHSYTCPCVAVLPVTGGNPDYLAWIVAETSGN